MSIFASIRQEDVPWREGQKVHTYSASINAEPATVVVRDWTRAHEANSVLVAFREDERLTTPERARDYLLYLVQHRAHAQRQFSAEHIDHARRVLERLARWSS